MCFILVYSLLKMRVSCCTTLNIDANTQGCYLINDLKDDISSKVLKFADNTKVFRKVRNYTDKQRLRDDLDNY